MNAALRVIALPILLLASLPTRLAAGPDPAASSPALESILQRFDQVQKETRSLTASFTERKDLKLLAKPVLSEGSFYFSRPGRIKWEYSGPEPRVFLITEEHYLAYFPAQKRAEDIPLNKFTGRRVFRVFGIGQTAEDLGKFFDIALADAGGEKGAHLLVLTPKRKRVKDRLELVRFWVDERTYLPRRLDYVESDGDTTSLHFSNIRINTEIAEARFAVDLPKDVQVSNSFSGLTGATASR